MLTDASSMQIKKIHRIFRRCCLYI
jgi:hypothetical protein